MRIYNTLSRNKEVFKPIKSKKVGLYTCGPTVYGYAHIGNLRSYLFEDILKRVLILNNYKVKHVMNITDVGHLTSDSDTGEDKIEMGARKEKKTAKQITAFYTKEFKNDLKNLNIISPDIYCKATEYIREQIDLIKKLEKKGFTYAIKDGIYFNTSKIKDYGKLAKLKKEDLKAGARVKITEGKKNPTDFALWKFTPKGVKRQQEWDSPWEKGFPGWHLECSAMSIKHLGIPFDIHTGGIDHINVHHTNEIAQSESAYGKKFVNYWMHNEFLVLKDMKMSKSEGTGITISSLIEKGYNPLSFRYLTLGTHYRSQLSFDFKILESAQNTLNNLYKKIREFKTSKEKELSEKAKKYLKQFSDFINDDLNTPKVLALMWEVIKTENIKDGEKYTLLLEFDKVFGLDLKAIKKIQIPKEIKSLAEKREKYRKEEDWEKADKIRKEIEKKRYIIEDIEKGIKIRKSNE